MKLRVGTSGKEENAYPTLNIMTITAECTVGNLSETHPLLEMARIQGGVPDPTFGYLRKFDWVSTDGICFSEFLDSARIEQSGLRGQIRTV